MGRRVRVKRLVKRNFCPLSDRVSDRVEWVEKETSSQIEAISLLPGFVGIYQLGKVFVLGAAGWQLDWIVI